MPTAIDLVQALYDAHHGLPLARITPSRGPGPGVDPVAWWRDFWRALDFDTPTPTGSSRLMEMALAQSTAPGSTPRDMVRALHDVLGDAQVSPNTAHDFFARTLFAFARGDRERFGDLFGYADPLPVASLTPAQAAVAAWFIASDHPDAGKRYDALVARAGLHETDPG